MRIWLDPYKLQGYGLTPADVKSAIAAQNAQVSAGQLGARPSSPEQELHAIVNAQSRTQTPDQFRQILLRTNRAGSVERNGDVARARSGVGRVGTECVSTGRPRG